MKKLPFVLALSICSQADAQSVLPLKPGTYVATGTACKDAPLAMTQMVNSSGIQYPHLWGCKAQIIAHHGGSYSLDQVCNGGEHDKIVVSVLSRDAYSVGPRSAAQKFRYCSATIN